MAVHDRDEQRMLTRVWDPVCGYNALLVLYGLSDGGFYWG